MGLTVIQRNIRKWLTLRNWQWWKLYTRVKPLLSIARQEDEMKKMEEEFEKTKEELARIEKLAKELEEQNVTLLQAKNDLFLQLQAEQVGPLYTSQLKLFPCSQNVVCEATMWPKLCL